MHEQAHNIYHVNCRLFGVTSCNYSHQVKQSMLHIDLAHVEAAAACCSHVCHAATPHVTHRLQSLREEIARQKQYLEGKGP